MPKDLPPYEEGVSAGGKNVRDIAREYRSRWEHVMGADKRSTLDEEGEDVHLGTYHCHSGENAICCT